MFWVILAAVVAAYLIGSFSSAVWIGKLFFGKDVRDYGSHNAGTTNTIRVLGVKPGIVVLLIDALKGWISVSLGVLVFRIVPETLDYEVWIKIALAAAAVLGHVFPIYTGFRGGKGVATLAGVLIALYPASFPVTLGVFLIVFLFTRYVSLASVLAAAAFPFIDTFLFRQDEPTLQVFSVLVAVFILITHRKNIGRLLRGEESKLSFKKKDE